MQINPINQNYANNYSKSQTNFKGFLKFQNMAINPKNIMAISKEGYYGKEKIILSMQDGCKYYYNIMRTKGNEYFEKIIKSTNEAIFDSKLHTEFSEDYLYCENLMSHNTKNIL